MDFKKATELFADPDFDGDPVQIYEPKDDDPPVPPDDDDGDTGSGNGGDGPGGGVIVDPPPPEPGEKRVKYVIDDVPVMVLKERVQYYGNDGKLITESLKDYTRNSIHKEYASLDDFLTVWSSAEQKSAVLIELEKHGVLLDALAEEVGRDLDPFDLVCHIAWGQPPLTRRERADNVRKRDYFTKNDPSFILRDNYLAKPYTSWGPNDRVHCIVTNPPFGGMEEDGTENNFPQNFRTRETADLFLALIIRLLRPGGRARIVLPDGSLFGEGVKTRIKQHLLEECNLHTIVRLPNGVFNPYTGIKTNLLFFTKGEPTKTVWYYEHTYPKGVKSYNKTKPIHIDEFKPIAKWWGKDTPAGRARRKESEFAWSVSIDDLKANGYNLDIKNPNAEAAKHGDPDELLAEYKELLKSVAQARDALKNELAAALNRAGGTC